MGPMSDRVTVSVEEGVADVRLNRPEKMNALDGEQFAALIEAGRSIGEDRGLRAVVLSGEGRAFSAGLDMGLFQGKGEIPTIEARADETPGTIFQRSATIWQDAPIPVIAAVHGVAYGAGLQIALAADIRFVAPDARLSVMEIRWGLVPDLAVTQTLPPLVGIDVAKELTWTGRILSGSEAAELGIATHVSDDPRADALALARDIAARSPDAVRAGKELWSRAPRLGRVEGLELEAELQRRIIGRANQTEAVLSNVEKRPPRFRDPE